MAADALRVLRATGVAGVTADTNGSAVDLKTGTPLHQTMFARVRSYVTGLASTTWVFHIEGSSDNSNWYRISSYGLNGTDDSVTADGYKVVHLPVVTKLRYIRLVADVTGATPGTLTYSGDLVLSSQM